MRGQKKTLVTNQLQSILPSPKAMALIDTLRQFREPVFGTSWFDTGGTLAIGALLWWYFDLRKETLPLVVVALLLLGHLAHTLFRVETVFSKPR